MLRVQYLRPRTCDARSQHTLPPTRMQCNRDKSIVAKVSVLVHDL